MLDYLAFRLIGFTFGTRVDHWWLSEPRDEFAGDFWQITEDGRSWKREGD
jgi:hypothetical protein